MESVKIERVSASNLLTGLNYMEICVHTVNQREIVFIYMLPPH
jgi:hypothetical protein